MRVIIVRLPTGKASIRNQAGEWWCAEHGWVHPYSTYWFTRGDVWNVEFPHVAGAREYARLNGWTPSSTVDEA